MTTFPWRTISGSGSSVGEPAASAAAVSDDAGEPALLPAAVSDSGDPSLPRDAMYDAGDPALLREPMYDAGEPASLRPELGDESLRWVRTTSFPRYWTSGSLSSGGSPVTFMPAAAAGRGERRERQRERQRDEKRRQTRKRLSSSEATAWAKGSTHAYHSPQIASEKLPRDC